jgi:hypothetical protein
MDAGEGDVGRVLLRGRGTHRIKARDDRSPKDVTQSGKRQEGASPRYSLRLMLP